MPPRSRRQATSADDLLGEFTDRLSATVRKPNIYRLKPLPQQELFLQSQAKIRVAFGGNRAGKTHINAADMIMALTHRHPCRQGLYPDGPLRMRWIGVDFERGIDQGAIPKFQELLPPSFLINGAWEDSYSSSKHILTLADGSTVSFMSYEQDPNKFQVVSLHHTAFDEEPPIAIWEEDVLRHVDVAGFMTLSETPVMQLEWVQDEIVDPAEAGFETKWGRAEVFHLDTRDNVYLPVEELLSLSRNMSVEDVIVRLQGRYKSGSRVFPEFEPKYPFVIPAEAFRLTPDHVVYESMDHGYKNPTSWNWTAVAPDGGIVLFKHLYSPGLVVSEWAKAVKQQRVEICKQYGIPYPIFETMLKGTFGDPSIGDGGNAQAQTGLTIQQAYSAEGVGISTGNIRQARATNQNLGLDMFHTYMRMRPDLPMQPWLQITDECPSAVDELRRARIPKQSAINLAVKNASEQIRDKDNHFIDAEKYLFIVTLDLRPLVYRQVDNGLFEEVGRRLGVVPTQVTTHREVFDATMASHNSWVVHESGGYSSLEE